MFLFLQKLRALFHSFCYYLFRFIILVWLRRWFPSPGVPCSKPLSGSKVDSAFDPSEVDKMGTRNFWELSGKK